MVAGALLLILIVAWTRCGIMGCPDVRRLASYRPGGAPVLLDREGRPFGDLAPVEGELVTLRSLPKHVPQAFLAVEDRRFYEHGAVDWMRVVGALWANLRSRKVEEGSSTITMQLARNVFPDQISRDKKPTRKLKEIRVAVELERTFPKDTILQLYLNQINLGPGAYGVEAASQVFFGKSVRDVNIAEAAMLAALARRPGSYDPRNHPDRAVQRRNLVLSLMRDQGYLTPEEAERWNDRGRAERAREELDAIEAELRSSLGLGGRARRSSSAAERARVNVQRRLKDAIRRIGEQSPALARHLDWAVKTGTFCSYEPGTGG